MSSDYSIRDKNREDKMEQSGEENSENEKHVDSRNDSFILEKRPKEKCIECVHLQDKLREEQKRCIILRENIHKVSANWFHRKTQISESENDADLHPVSLLDETTKIGNNEGRQAENDLLDKNNIKSEGDKSSALSKDFSKLVSIIAQKSAQLDLADSQCYDLKKRMREYEQIIDNKDDIIHGMKDQLETYLTDNQKMSIQLNNLTTLFKQLEKVDKETVGPTQTTSADTDGTALTVPLPTQEEFQEMASSVSRTYIKLKDLIYEKKALVTEIERLNTLNVELQRRVVQQETRLVSVSDALHQTWLVVSDLKEDHEKLHNDERIMRYELKEKREILTRLRKELESARAQWQIIRQKNFESEQEYTSIRAMLEERRKSAIVSLEEPEESCEGHLLQTNEAVSLHPDDAKSFDPPVDLLLEMGLEYGIIGEEAEMTQTVLDVIGGEDVRNSRLEQLEEHCSLLYQKLIASTSRSLSLASRLSRFQEDYGHSDDEFDAENEQGDILELDEEESEEDDDEEDDDDVEEDLYYTDANHLAMMETILSSPDSEEYDTAYVSETEGAELPVEQEIAETTASTSSDFREDQNTAQANGEPSSSQVGGSSLEETENITNTGDSVEAADYEENCDQLSRTLINFLPKKIEFLKAENIRLEQTIVTQREERLLMEDRERNLEKDKLLLEDNLKILKRDMNIENIQRKQLEEQLRHLGKCVDELKLKHRSEVSRYFFKSLNIFISVYRVVLINIYTKIRTILFFNVGNYFAS